MHPQQGGVLPSLSYCAKTPNRQTRGVSCLSAKQEARPASPRKTIHDTLCPPLCDLCRYMPAALRDVCHCFFLCFPQTPNSMEPNDDADMEDLLSPFFFQNLQREVIQ